MNDNSGDIIIYQTEDGLTKIDVKIENETVWLSQQQMSELFGTSRTNIIEQAPLEGYKAPPSPLSFGLLPVVLWRIILFL